MHGCRECDWDACEACTDNGEGGLVKCSFVQDLAASCNQQLMHNKSSPRADDRWNGLSELDTGPKLNHLAVRLLQRDTNAVRDLSVLLDTPGQVTMYQFQVIVLPSLHAALMNGGKSLSQVLTPSGHRSKKARFSKGSFRNLDSLGSDDALPFCKELVRMLVTEKIVALDHCKEDVPDDSMATGEEASIHNDSSPHSQDEEDRLDSVKTGTPELLGRLQKVLSMYEDVSILPTIVHAKSPAGSGRSNSCHLSVLSLPIELQLTPFPVDSSRKSSESAISVLIEPLIAARDLELHVLRTCSLKNTAYESYCMG